MSATTTGAVARNTNDIPWNKHVRQKKTPADWAVDFVIVLLLVFTVVAVLYPLWFVVIASFSNPNKVAAGDVLLLLHVGLHPPGRGQRVQRHRGAFLLRNLNP